MEEGDQEFDGDKIESESDDESTIAKEEKIGMEQNNDELKELQAENEQCLEDLLKVCIEFISLRNN